MTKLDVLTGIDPLKVAVAYRLEGRELHHVPSDPAVLRQVEPVYRELKGWTEPLEGCRTPEELPRAARDYLKFLEDHCGAPALLVGVGPAREATILQGL